MGSQYSTVTLNGVELPSTDVSTRSTSVSGISQFLLQTVEVYKTITPDMDGNSVAGSINLTLAPASDTVHYGILAEGGYNDMNNYWGNYKFGGNYSNRFFNKKLGLRLDVNAERVNRSTQTMSGSYGVVSNSTSGLGYEQLLLNDAALNDINNIKEKQAATLVLDYSFSPTSKIFFYNFLSNSSGSYLSASKDYNFASNQENTTVYQDNSTKNILYQGSVRVEHKFSLFDLDYGGAFSQSHMYSPERRTWTFMMSPGFDDEYVTYASRSLSPVQLVGSSYDNGSSSALSNTILGVMGKSSDEMLQKDMTTYFNVKTKFDIGNSLSGFIKGGGKFKQTERQRTYMVGSVDLNSAAIVGQLISSSLNFVDYEHNNLLATGLSNGNVSDFLGYNYGWNPNVSSLNKIWDWWNSYSNDLMSQGKAAVINAVGSYNRIGFSADEYSSSFFNQRIKERYLGTYLMSEVNYNDFATLSLGARYEKVTDDLIGNYVTARMYTQIYGFNIPQTPAFATHNDEYLLPMTHIKIKPNDWMQVNLSYTNALTRPDYAALVPNTYLNQGLSSTTKQYIVGNPYIKPELWKNYDIQVAVYNNELGLASVNGFYKEVKNKIWSRTYYRIKGDAVLPGFADNDLVQVTETVNHTDPGNVKGIEFEWQTNFWYLPSPFNYFSLNFNYTILKSQIQYPTTRVYTTYTTASNGKTSATMHRVDSTVTDRILNQPNNIANVSLGFNYSGFNAWLSFQYTGDMLTGWSYQKELVQHKNHFYRWDFQVAQELPVKGLVLLFNVANINNMQETSGLSNDYRDTYIESYGWTSDLGLKYNF
jgi:TonB-dependent receptor